MELELILHSLPQITERVRSKTSEIIGRLKELPEPPQGNLPFRILEKIWDFEREMRHHLDGGAQEYSFRKEWYTAAVRFRHTIACSYPRLSLSDILVTCHVPRQLPFHPSSTPTEVIDVSDEDVEASQNMTPRSNSKRKQPALKATQISPTKRARLQDIPQHVPSQQSASVGLASLASNNGAPFAKRFSLTEIRSILQDAHVGLPDQIDTKATKRLIRESISLWDEPLDELLAFTHKACHALIVERASSVFGIWQGTQFFDVALEVCQGFLEEEFNRQTASAKEILDVERQDALTLNESTMRAATERAFLQLEHACRIKRAEALLRKTDDWNDEWDHSKKEKKISEVTDTELGPNPYVYEIRALSVCHPSPSHGPRSHQC